MTEERQDRERLRLQALEAYEILDTPREPAFDEVVRLAADICEAPIALVSFVGNDRLFFKAAHGVDLLGMDRDMSFCESALLQDELMLVPDASQDPRFAQTPLVAGDSHIRFYAGAQLRTAEGLPIGTLCVLDAKPRGLDDLQRRTLEVLGHQVMHQLNLRRELKLRDESDLRYRTLFDTMGEGFCIIEFLDGPHGPMSDYVHVEANAAYALHAGIPDVVGQRLREMVSDVADDWIAR
jgi:GAF domain-containing protein